MKPLKTAPQILEHYGLLYLPICEIGFILKAMRHYARLRIEKEREKIKDGRYDEIITNELYEELYQEAKDNVLKQYNK